MALEHRAGKLAVLLHADVAGSTSLVQQDEHIAHERIQAVFRRFGDTIRRYHGRVRELRGDALLAEFGRASDAVTAALAFQTDQAKHNKHIEDDIRPTVRVGIAIGEVVFADGTVTGAGVVLAQRMEQLADPGGIRITGAIQEALPQRLPFDQQDLGAQSVKGFEKPVHVYSVRLRVGAEPPEPSVMRRWGRSPLGRVPMTAVVIVLICGVGLLAWLRFSAPEFEPVALEAMSQPLPAKPSIAVLAFDDHSAGDDKGYLSDAISEGIISELSRFSELFVIARNSSFKYRDSTTDVRDIAMELGVRYVLEGSQQKAGDRLRVTAQLIDALAGNHIWSENYDRDLADLFAVQDEIAGSVASTVGSKIIVVAGEEAKRADPAQLSAFQHHLIARRYYHQFTPEGMKQARLANQAAIEAAPDQPDGYRGLAFIYTNAYRWGWLDLPREEALSRARQYAVKTVELAPNAYASHFVMGYVHGQAGEYDQAISRFEKALELNPNAADVLATMAEPLVYTGRSLEAVDLVERAMRLDPHHPNWFTWNLGWAQYFSGHYEDALATMQGMPVLPNLARRTLAAIHVRLGQLDQARAVMKTFLKNNPDYTVRRLRLDQGTKFQDQAMFEQFVADLRKAGLPD